LAAQVVLVLHHPSREHLLPALAVAVVRLTMVVVLAVQVVVVQVRQQTLLEPQAQ
jgi:hypothetical protein